MTGSDIRRFSFSRASIKTWGAEDRRFVDWPVVYVLDRGGDAPGTSATRKSVYVGETRNATMRMRQHLDSGKGEVVDTVRVIVGPRFNKSACLDLESHLIRWFSGDGSFTVLNRNDGITDADYFDRSTYREDFRTVFEELRAQGLFSRSIPQIENTDLFKLSPFKALTESQAVAVEQLLESLVQDLAAGESTLSVVQGEPGTGKTIVAIYLLKLIADVQAQNSVDDLDPDTMFSDFFENGSGSILQQRRVGFVIPQQSLRKSVKRVFAKTPGLSPAMVLSPFDVGKSNERFDLLVVDEAHRLGQRANQSSGVQNAAFRDITEQLFGADDKSKTQLDWLRAQSDHLVLLVDPEQSVRPGDVPESLVRSIVSESKGDQRFFPLLSQMRVAAGDDYVGFVRGLFADRGTAVAPVRREFVNYDLRLFDNLRDMRSEIFRREQETGLSRLLAGFAWPWRSKTDPEAFDIEIEGLQLRWNGTDVDWIASPGSVDEVGSIHTVQGYDLNYAGVIIGPDLRFTPERGLFIDRESYHDKKGKENNPTLGLVYDDAALRRYIVNIYSVLLSRGMLGTYVYVCDEGLRSYLRPFFSGR